MPLLSNLSNDFAVITNTTPTVFRIPMPPGILPNKYPGTPNSNVLAIGVPSAWIAFAMNIFTQGLCINGVNRLTSVSIRRSRTQYPVLTIFTYPQRVSSVSVNLILTVRKAVSLGISVWFYGAGFNKGLTTGAAMVLGKRLPVLRDQIIPTDADARMRPSQWVPSCTAWLPVHLKQDRKTTTNLSR